MNKIAKELLAIAKELVAVPYQYSQEEIEKGFNSFSDALWKTAKREISRKIKDEGFKPRIYIKPIESSGSRLISGIAYEFKGEIPASWTSKGFIKIDSGNRFWLVYDVEDMTVSLFENWTGSKPVKKISVDFPKLSVRNLGGTVINAVEDLLERDMSTANEFKKKQKEYEEKEAQYKERERIREEEIERQRQRRIEEEAKRKEKEDADAKRARAVIDKYLERFLGDSLQGSDRIYDRDLDDEVREFEKEYKLPPGSVSTLDAKAAMKALEKDGSAVREGNGWGVPIPYDDDDDDYDSDSDDDYDDDGPSYSGYKSPNIFKMKYNRI